MVFLLDRYCFCELPFPSGWAGSPSVCYWSLCDQMFLMLIISLINCFKYGFKYVCIRGLPSDYIHVLHNKLGFPFLEFNSDYYCFDGCVFICSITYISNCEIFTVWIELRLLLLWWLCFYLQYYIHIKLWNLCSLNWTQVNVVVMVVFLFAVLHTYQTVKSVQFELNSGYCCCDGCVFICSITYISNCEICAVWS